MRNVIAVAGIRLAVILAAPASQVARLAAALKEKKEQAAPAES